MSEGQARGEFRPELDPRRTAETIFAGILGIDQAALLLPRKLDIAARTEWLLDLLVAGLRPAPPRPAAVERSTDDNHRPSAPPIARDRRLDRHRSISAATIPVERSHCSSSASSPATPSRLRTFTSRRTRSPTIDGTLEVTVGDEVRVVRAGESIFKPRKVAHAFAIAGERPVRFLETITFAGFEGYFRALAEMVRDTRGVDRGIADRLMSEYGLRNA